MKMTDKIVSRCRYCGAFSTMNEETHYEGCKIIGLAKGTPHEERIRVIKTDGKECHLSIRGDEWKPGILRY